MLLLIVMLTFGVLFLTRVSRLAEAPEVRSKNEFRAYIDGKPVDSYMKEK